MAKKIYQVHIALKSSQPKIWRRILIPSDLLLKDFHLVIQVAMGWTNSHLHQFVCQGNFYGEPDDEMWGNMEDYSGMKVSDLLKREKDSLMYEYDFGDGWIHQVVLEKVLPEPGVSRAGGASLDDCQKRFTEALRFVDREREYSAEKARYQQAAVERCSEGKWYDLGFLECVLFVPLFGLILPFFGLMIIGTVRSVRQTSSTRATD